MIAPFLTAKSQRASSLAFVGVLHQQSYTQGSQVNLNSPDIQLMTQYSFASSHVGELSDQQKQVDVSVQVELRYFTAKVQRRKGTLSQMLPIAIGIFAKTLCLRVFAVNSHLQHLSNSCTERNINMGLQL
jgi:hypothetical protein